MDFFEDWYSQPNDVNEQDQEKLLASMLAAAAADTPTGGLQNDPQVNSDLASDPSDFINRIVENNTIPQLVNRGIADINSCFEMGFYLTIVTLRSNGLELAIGMHIAHNFVVTLVPHITAYQPVYLTIFFPICAFIMYLILFRRTAMPYPETEERKNVVRSFNQSSE